MSAPARADDAAPTPVWLERAGVLLLLLAALVPRARGLFGPFDRELEGFQGSCFAAFAINYERLGVGRFGGYPTFNVLLPSDPAATPYLYPNHPPLVPLLGWASLKAWGPAGWDEAWRAGRAPQGVEGPLRLPFFVLHVGGLLALWWAVRQGGSARLALLSLAVAACVPISIVYAYLVNYENPYLVCLLLACGFHVRWLLRGSSRALLGAALALAAAAAITFAPVFFLPPLLLQTVLRRGWRPAAREAAALVPAALVPVLVHGVLVRQLPLADSVGVVQRAQALLRPLFDGSKPLAEWASRQGLRLEYFLSPGILWVAAAGLVVVLARALRRGMRASRVVAGAERPAEVSLALPLLLGGAAILLGFYTHTFDGDGATNGQTLFLLNLAPAAAVLAAHLLDALAPALYRLRGGLAPLVVATSLVCVPALLRAGAIQRAWRDPGPRDDPRVAGPATALPSTYGRELAALLPADAIGLVPHSMAFTPAVSFYAWRQLVPVSRASWGKALARIEEVLELGDRPRFMLLPRDPPAGIRAEIESVRADLARRFQPVAVGEHWELWPPFE